MRPGYKCIDFLKGNDARTSVDKTPNEFKLTMEYNAVKYSGREHFLAEHSQNWELELNSELKKLLYRNRTILGVGSGECEQEIRLHLDGYQVVGSDILPEAFSQTLVLFAAFKAIYFDIFEPDFQTKYDDLLINGLDTYFDNTKAQLIFENARLLLNKSGRLIYILRYKDNLITFLIDYGFIPILCIWRNVHARLVGNHQRSRLKHHGYRRSQGEIIKMAEKAGFRIGKVLYAGFGVELTRMDVNYHMRRLYDTFSKLDRHLHWLNNAIIFEFLT